MSFLANRLPASVRGKVCIAIALGGAVGCAPESVAVNPERWSGFFFPGQRRHVELEVDIRSLATRYPPLDILFLFDRTQSMGDVVASMQQEAGALMTEIGSSSSEARFAVALVGDYALFAVPDGGSNTPWELLSNFTTDRERTLAALDRVTLQHGGDYPEAYVRGLYETSLMDWRQSARKFVIFFADAPGHDDEFYPGLPVGSDPGRDGVRGTGDDLRMKPVLQSLRDSNIAVVPVHQSNSSWLGDKTYLNAAVDGFERMATSTGGIRKEIGAPSEVSRAILSAIRESYFPQPVVVTSGEVAKWVSASLPKASARAPSEFSSTLHVQPPDSAPSGVYEIALPIAYAEDPSAKEVARSTLRVVVGIWGIDWSRWRWWLLLLFLPFLLLARMRSLAGGRSYGIFLDRRSFFAGVFRRVAVVAVLVVAVWGLGSLLPKPTFHRIGTDTPGPGPSSPAGPTH
jgi:hypothetical protein